VLALALTAWVMPLAVWWLSKVAQFRMRDYARNMAPIVVSLVPAIAAGHMVVAALDLPALIVLAAAASAAVFVYAASAVLIDANLRRSVIGTVCNRGLRQPAVAATVSSNEASTVDRE
jgi:hypothetical protein